MSNACGETDDDFVAGSGPRLGREVRTLLACNGLRRARIPVLGAIVVRESPAPIHGDSSMIPMRATISAERTFDRFTNEVAEVIASTSDVALVPRLVRHRLVDALGSISFLEDL